MKSIGRLQVIIDMSGYGERPVPGYIPPPPASTLTPKKPDEAQKKIAEKVRDKQSH